MIRIFKALIFTGLCCLCPQTFSGPQTCDDALRRGLFDGIGRPATAAAFMRERALNLVTERQTLEIPLHDDPHFYAPVGGRIRIPSRHPGRGSVPEPRLEAGLKGGSYLDIVRNASAADAKTARVRESRTIVVVDVAMSVVEPSILAERYLDAVSLLALKGGESFRSVTTGELRFFDSGAIENIERTFFNLTGWAFKADDLVARHNKAVDQGSLYDQKLYETVAVIAAQGESHVLKALYGSGADATVTGYRLAAALQDRFRPGYGSFSQSMNIRGYGDQRIPEAVGIFLEQSRR